MKTLAIHIFLGLLFFANTTGVAQLKNGTTGIGLNTASKTIGQGLNDEECDIEVTDIIVASSCSQRSTSEASDFQGPFCANIEYCFRPLGEGTPPSDQDPTITWTFTDQNGPLTVEGQFASYTFATPGSYGISVVVTYPNGCTSNTYFEKILIEDCDDSCDEIAIIVDESGSISQEEALQLRRGLSRFVEDQMGSGLLISIIGMSDSDGRIGIDSSENIRPETTHILNKKVTPDTKQNLFDPWIAAYGNRNGERGVSGSSDYWASGLSVVNRMENKPDLVVIFTDGSQTADRDYLKEQIQQIRPTPLADSDPSRLYVYGIDSEYYVNAENLNTLLSRGEDPNYPTAEQNQKAAFNDAGPREVVASIRTSLDFLLGTDTPESGKENLLFADYYGYDDFTGFAGTNGTSLGVLSNLLANSGLSCTTPIDECYDCYTFQPEPTKSYWLSGWAKEDLNIQVKSYTNTSIVVKFINAIDAEIASKTLLPTGDIIDGWQRIAGEFEIPAETVTLELELLNDSANIPVYFDDIRVHPINGSMKSFVYDPITYRLMAELDENNYSTYYEYDNEGGLVRVKKETSKGIKTIQETRSGTVIKTNN